jgi:protein-L-isoaspartate(D-aspartate) O-methyltransferase
MTRIAAGANPVALEAVAADRAKGADSSMLVMPSGCLPGHSESTEHARMLPDADPENAQLYPSTPASAQQRAENVKIMTTQAAALAERLRPTIHDERVLAAIASVPREQFVPERDRRRAYENVALPIACGQTISQPLVVGRMLDVLRLRPADRVLDVGTGSGYHAALLARLAQHVWTIERHAELSELAQDAARILGIENITFIVGDGSRGLPEQAPFDAINVAAAVGESVPPELDRQLAPGGRLVAPVGLAGQYLTLARRTPNGVERRMLEPVRFVPLVQDR